jgi:hypothetical protein
MAFKTNYGMKRADRNRAQKARNEEKLKERQERSARRKADREGGSADAQSDEGGLSREPK